jgi:hypothetical protein
MATPSSSPATATATSISTRRIVDPELDARRGAVRRPAPFGAFAPPDPIAELNTPSSDEDPWLTADGMTIYFSSEAGGTLDLYVATR